MKKIILILFFISTTLLAQLNWIANLDDAYDIAEEENKIVFVILSQEGCPACIYMKNIVLKNKYVIEEFNKNFVAVHLDIHHDDVPLELEHFMTPTLYFLNADEEILGGIDSYQNEKDFLNTLKKIRKSQ